MYNKNHDFYIYIYLYLFDLVTDIKEEGVTLSTPLLAFKWTKCPYPNTPQSTGAFSSVVALYLNLDEQLHQLQPKLCWTLFYDVDYTDVHWG